ncbi:hypothetical protein [Brevundimonas sp.]|uniref:hypothetical protein n=1 Tax=Brevundimonas sp. TaxID=1871086 RepID=UPI002D1FC20E|nr:hypothetical protein [Brevundimonas sp.]
MAASNPTIGDAAALALQAQEVIQQPPALRDAVRGVARALVELGPRIDFSGGAPGQDEPDERALQVAEDRIKDLIRVNSTILQADVTDYQTPIFQCWSDYQKCCADSLTPKAGCVALVTVCILQQLMPLAGKQ